MKVPTLAIAATCLATLSSFAQDDADALAQQLSNPVASLISAPIQFNYDDGYANGGWRSVTNIQPVIPISISQDWNLISRTIVPVIFQEDITAIGQSEEGLGDVLATAFFSPKAPTKNGLIWGVGPVVSLPVGDTRLTVDRWLLGPSAVFLKQTGPWTYGALLNQVWDVGGSGNADVNAMFVQPFLAWGGLGDGQTLTINSESTYDWNGSQLTMPINVVYSKVGKLGDQLVSYAIGGRVYLDSPSGGPDWGIRLVVTFLFPKG
jgi:hypothetical protein